jgi:hypothetical protein
VKRQCGRRIKRAHVHGCIHTACGGASKFMIAFHLPMRDTRSTSARVCFWSSCALCEITTQLAAREETELRIVIGDLTSAVELSTALCTFPGVSLTCDRFSAGHQYARLTFYVAGNLVCRYERSDTAQKNLGTTVTVQCKNSGVSVIGG